MIMTFVFAPRTRFKKEIVAEFMAPRRKSNKVMILCDGMPSVPHKGKLLEFWAKKGYWVFHPRYRGSWESEGEFLRAEPTKDIIDVIDGIIKGFVDLSSGERFKISHGRIFLIGSSFGGAAAILATLDPRVSKVIAISPVTDWISPSRQEPVEQQGNFVKKNFGFGYRLPAKNWRKLLAGDFYNPIAKCKQIDGKKLMIIHAKYDKVVSWKSANTFAKKTKSQLYTLKKGGHLSSSIIMKPRWYKKIKKFVQE